MTTLSNLDYCASRFQAKRRLTREVMVGNVGVGGSNPIRIQSMTTTNTMDVDATVAQTLALAEAGCEIVRITAPNKQAAAALGEISKKVRAAKCDVPLVADIHFLPSAAMEAALHVEKVRINPGNYADKKKFAVLEYTDAAYNEELERLHETFSPIVLRCKELGRAMRIGTNHGSLSDRLMNRYGDSPLGMVESALEFIRIAESHGYQDICLSMKASNPKVMVEAYRLAVARMIEEGMDYPLHLGVTEAGDGEDARVKSAIGIGTLLNDGLGDTIRVSLTEDPIYEVPVARDLADKAMALWEQQADSPLSEQTKDSINPFDFERRKTRVIELGNGCNIGGETVPAVIVKTAHPVSATNEIIQDVCRTQMKMKESKIEGLQISVRSAEDLEAFKPLHEALHTVVKAFVLELSDHVDLSELEVFEWPEGGLAGITLLQHISQEDAYYAATFLQFCRDRKFNCAIDCTANALRDEIGAQLAPMGSANLILTRNAPSDERHPVGSYRALAEAAKAFVPDAPIWIRNTLTNTLEPKDYFTDRMLEASILSGAVLCDGIGDAISIETEPLLEKATTLAYNILQGARSRISKTEFIACPSCGRTLFDLQSVTQKIRSRTDHLKGVTIAIMGCIVNGPGEMADADFGYVGGAPAKINLYVGKECVKYNVPAAEALDRLIDLIKEHGKWVEPT
ncbi:MAG: (E)-4-hydroxy-3-methylbut-2-enyl-diphosphate synthase [Opitutales bacterium]|nr:(E)-4-hydroxy-3-methylbut-2-enyl-diphosphate synthase [Opitutales bacterium]MDP4777397.1 (E)-4-hydroxy-3-methylbut-2-enyl-diphosphate synthase [Opitutales bacterium]MDP4883460.1 (E)-4-hydroxy-3-methylbut-2-enyl-diphosphate synthase [Opitutales bacterium]MDP5080260.1 (E)-4-hydroxy-3-methylbut-2-enyl-diphosphate synthase [Opitutales bacterium]